MALASGNYLVSVREFGPIAEAQVEARPLTVFVETIQLCVQATIVKAQLS